MNENKDINENVVKEEEYNCISDDESMEMTENIEEEVVEVEFIEEVKHGQTTKKSKNSIQVNQLCKKVGISAISLGLIFGVAFGGGYLGQQTAQQNTNIPVTQTSAIKVETTDVSVVAQTASSSVVAITTESVSTGSFMNQYVSEGAGSGVIISEDGYIITNHHVISDASSIQVTLSDDKVYEAQLVGYDESVDIAVLKIEANNLTVAAIGDSDDIQVGESVVAIGNPLGELGGTVSEGIISASSRTLTIENQEMTLLQTTAAINPGNSGGGLFNLSGELIGVVNAKSSGEDIEGIGFAIPSNTAIDVANQIIEKQGNVSTNTNYTLGVQLLEIIDEEDLKKYNVEKQGVYIYDVMAQSDAQQLGLQSGDLIKNINGEDITSVEQMQEIIKDLEEDDKLTIVIERNGREYTLSMRITL